MENNNEEYNQIMIKLAKKQLMYQRISAGCILGMLIVMVWIATSVLPQITYTVEHLNEIATKADSSLSHVDTMIDGIIKATDNMNKLVEENAEDITSATKSMSEIDFQGLNQAIKDLQDAVGPVANFFNKFR